MVRKNGSNCLHRATVRGVSANGRRGGTELGEQVSFLRRLASSEAPISGLVTVFLMSHVGDATRQHEASLLFEGSDIFFVAIGKHGSLMRVMNQTENNRSRGLVGDWLAGRALRDLTSDSSYELS
jgi:hypothetical protein